MQTDANARESSVASEGDSGLSEAELDARHAEKMRKKKAGRDRLSAEKTREKGLIVVHTGPGKGKSTAAFGMIFRALGHDMRVAIVQFVKGKWETGERTLLERLGGDRITISALGEGFTWETQDRQRDIAAARAAWEMAKELIARGEHALVLLDELNIVLRYDYLPVAEVVSFLREHKPPHVHVIITGRNAKPELVELADLVTEMSMVKHHFHAGVKAQQGIEF